MIETILAWGSFSVGEFFQQLEQLDFFRLVLPFLLIFALVYALLSNIPLFDKNKGAAVLIAFAIGLLSLQLGFVSAFFQDFSPKLAIGLSVLLAALILAGVFLIDDDKAKRAYRWIFFGLGGLIFLIIVASSLSSSLFVGSDFFNDYGAMITVIIIVAAAIAGVIVANKKE